MKRPSLIVAVALALGAGDTANAEMMTLGCHLWDAVVISKTGVNTEKAVMHGEATKADIARYCRRVARDPSQKLDFNACLKANLSAAATVLGAVKLDVVRRAPYVHDSSLATLTAVIDLYDQGGISRPSRSELIQPLGLTPSEKADLVAFLNTLTGTPQPIPPPNPTR